MNVRFQRLISGSRGQVPAGRSGLLDDVRYLKERRGEKIAALDAESGALLGAIGLHPDRDEGGTFFHLAGIEVLPGHRAEGLEAGLFDEAGRYVREHKSTRLKFSTSPLLTANAELYIMRFGTRYRWREGARTPEGRPWPYVSCECDFEDPLARPLDLRDEEIVERSILEWTNGMPVLRDRIVYSGPLSVLLPDLTVSSIAEAEAADARFLTTLYAVFHGLFVHGYGFAWFDRLPAKAAPTGGVRWYYIMNRLLML